MRELKLIAISLFLLLAMLLSPAVVAHHSGTMFDFVNCRTVSGTVRALQWVYPHSWLWIDVTTENGNFQTWGFEFPSPTQLEHIDSQWTRSVVAKGDKVSVRFGPLKDGRSGGAMAMLMLPDGRALVGSPGLCGDGDPNPAARFH